MSTVSFELLASGFSGVEGPTIDDAGNLYFCDLFKGGVHRLTPDGSHSEVYPRRRYIGGLCLHADGGIVMSGKDISHLRNGDLRVLLDGDAVAGDGTRLAGYGDIHADPRGRLFAGTVRRGVDGQPGVGELVVLTAPGTANVVYSGVKLTNGIAASADGALIYHADSDARSIHIIEIDHAGTPTRKGTISTADLPGRPDGLATDVEGGIWVAFVEGGQIVRFSPDGNVDRRLETPSRNPLSVCFAGPNRTDLIVVTMDNARAPDLGASIFRVPVGVVGSEVGRARI